MITVTGTAEEISRVVRAMCPGYPACQLRNLTPGEWSYIFDGVEVRATITEAEEEQPC